MATNTLPSERAVIDVASLPSSELDHRSLIWWGNLLLLVIETVMFGLLVASYFYLRQNFLVWPPPQIHRVPPIFNPVPGLWFSTINLIAILVSAVPMFWADRAALRKNQRAVQLALVATIAVGLLTIALRSYEFRGLNVRWDDNAYASIVWTIVVMHLIHLIVGTAENILMAAWVFLKPLDDKHARDVRVNATYWYWIVAVWVPLYAIIYLGPRWH
jgi:cytochrome c oxidase subunit III